jgi:hypothetical protein
MPELKRIVAIVIFSNDCGDDDAGQRRRLCLRPP